MNFMFIFHATGCPYNVRKKYLTLSECLFHWRELFSSAFAHMSGVNNGFWNKLSEKLFHVFCFENDICVWLTSKIDKVKTNYSFYGK